MDDIYPLKNILKREESSDHSREQKIMIKSYEKVKLDMKNAVGGSIFKQHQALKGSYIFGDN